MNKTIQQYYNKLYTHKNNLPHAPQTEHTQHTQTIQKKYKHTTTKNGITYTTHLPLLKITRNTCPECNCHTYSYDTWRGEKVCPQCGLVLEDNLTNTHPIQPQTYKHTHKSFTKEEKQFLRKHGHYKKIYNGQKKEWTNNHNNRTIQTLTSQAQLNKRQKNETQYIIDTIGFKKLHSRASKPEIISAVIRYVMKQTYTNQAQLRYNQNIFKNLLTKEVYEVTEKNIQKHFQKTKTQTTKK